MIWESIFIVADRYCSLPSYQQVGGNTEAFLVKAFKSLISLKETITMKSG